VTFFSGEFSAARREDGGFAVTALFPTAAAANK
jgi:hypothetical protein